MPSHKITQVFKSRWNAVFWSLSVLLTAYCSVPSADQADSKSAAKDREATEKLLEKFTHQKPSGHHVNPWNK
jgi:hypothetical protein